MGATPAVGKGMVLVPMTRAVEPREMAVEPMEVPGALRVRVAEPTMTWVGNMVTVTAPAAAVVSAVKAVEDKIDRGMRDFILLRLG